MLTKEQVLSFLDILEISPKLPPEEIELALRKAGWSAADAIEAAKTLYPSEPMVDNSVAAVPPPAPTTAKPSGVVKTNESLTATPTPSTPEATTGVFALIGNTYREWRRKRSAARATTSSAVHNDSEKSVSAGALNDQSRSSVQSSHVPMPGMDSSNQTLPTGVPSSPYTGAVPAADTVEQRQSQVTPSSTINNEMLHAYYTGHHLSAETIHNMFGIDVTIRSDEISAVSRRRKGPEFSISQHLALVSVSLILAVAFVSYGMYHFKIGPFHPSVANDQPWVKYLHSEQ